MSGLYSIVALALASTAQPLLAQASADAGNGADRPASDDSGPAIGDIVVTATRQSQSLRRVPLNIVAKDQEALDKQGVRSIADLARLTPGVTFGQTSLNYGALTSSKKPSNSLL